jgi:hypothetical protein
VITDMALDPISNQLFFLYEDAATSRRRAPFGRPFPVIQRLDEGGGAPSPVYMLSNSSEVPTSLALDPQTKTLFFASNGKLSNNARSLGGLFAVSYDGSSFRPIGRALRNDTQAIHSLQYAKGSLYYVLRSGSTSKIVRFDIEKKTQVVISSSFAPSQVLTVERDSNVDLWVRDTEGNFYL